MSTVASIDKWNDAVDNTKVFETTAAIYKVSPNQSYGRTWLQGCKNCNDIVPLKYAGRRQMIGNVYQSLCQCTQCEGYVILDEHKERMLNIYLADIKPKL